ncbi:MAG: indolepyruvate ferredoxin oxidoreductase [Betaproteobacteria bacterium]|nr:indolepyruvate ferredoxin oxidoreductase [Betaproteobacteria bacterium]
MTSQTLAERDALAEVAADAATGALGASSTDALRDVALDDLRAVTLDDKYTATSGRIYLSGIQALVRLMLMQRWRDEAAELNTGGFVSGYRGSPIGGLDEALWAAEKFLAPKNIKFQPGLNEDLAATAVWGTQQVNVMPNPTVDGVYAMWYAKGPGVDRSGDVLKHANHFGTSPHGGVLLVAGDDHGAYSSTLPHQSDHMFAAAMIPMLYPSNVQEYLDLGIHGWAMSRFSGCYVGFKALADTVESIASVDADPHRVKIVLPEDFIMPPGGLNARLTRSTIGVSAREQEALMQDYKIYAALAYARANKLNHTVIDSPNPRLGIMASGKSYLDVLEALQELGIDDQLAAQIGIRVFKVAMPWPLEPDSVRQFAEGLDEVLVVEEKRQMVEYQLKEHLYNWREDVRPRVIGKFDEKGEWVHPRGEWLLSAKADLSVAQIARVIAARIARFHSSDRIKARLAFLEAKELALDKARVATPARPAYYCSGCPHNTSTKVPEGHLALAGIGCHAMAASIYPDETKTITHMGGEGVTWVGQAPFTGTQHVFANLGDGTYYHSGILAIRASIAAGVNITYKILYNDAVAMTGGQPFDGPLDVAMISQQVKAEGVTRIALVSDEPEKYDGATNLAAGATIHHRSEMDAVQRELAATPGTTILIYDQTCAAEKRRRRKKNAFPDPPKRVVINEAVCEGCGDCGKVSNCTSVMPLETEFGRKRTIDQSSCNKDYSCVNGFCPSFVTVEGGTLKKSKAGVTAKGAADANAALFADLPQPVLPVIGGFSSAGSCAASHGGPYGILITGIGGTGVITVGALLGMAAHLEGKGVSVLDMTGMSQKNGSVMSHVRIAPTPADIRAVRLASGEADAVLGCDLMTSASADALSKMQLGRARAVINTNEVPVGGFAQDPQWQYPGAVMEGLIEEATGKDGAWFLDATRIATALMGDSIATNLFMLGYAWQRGLIPLSEAAILRAIELNGVAVASNQQSFLWGRRAAHDLEKVTRIATPTQAISITHLLPPSLDKVIERRVAYLTDYQDAAYGERYRALVQRVRDAESSLALASSSGSNVSHKLAEAVAKNYFTLLAYKDEYEVARLYTDGNFLNKVASQFEGDYKLKFHLAPPVMNPPDPVTGKAKKSQFGAWMMPAFRVLKRFKFLRGTMLDPFGMTAERKAERALIAGYEQTIEELLTGLTAKSLALATDIAALPATIRGFGHVKEAAMKAAAVKREKLMRAWRGEEVVAMPVTQRAA